MPKIAPEITLINFVIDKKSTTPLYLQLYHGIRDLIVSGILRHGQRVPSSRQVALDFKVSRNIVNLAFEQLNLEGYISSKVGSGSFVSEQLPDTFIQSTSIASSKRNVNVNAKVDVLGNVSSYFHQRNAELEEIVPFQNAVPGIDIFPAKIWHRLTSKEFKNFKLHHLGYFDAQGYLPLRNSIADYLRSSRGVRCDTDQIVIVSGAQQALMLISLAFLKKGDLALIEDPGYINAKATFSLAGATIGPVPVEHGKGIDVNYLYKKEYANGKTLYLTPAHQYPLGGTLSLQKRIEILKWAAKNDVWVIEDDYDSEFRYSGKPLSSLQGLDETGKVIYLGSFSKVLFPGLRIGYVVLPSTELAQHFKYLKSIIDRQNSIMEQIVTNEFISQGYFARHLRSMRIAYAERQQVLIRSIEKELSGKLKVYKEDAGMHLIGWLPKEVNDKSVSQRLASEGIIANPLSDYVIKFKQNPGLLLGYTSFNKFKIRHHIQKMGYVL